MEKKLADLQKRELDNEIAKRLKFSQGTIDMFIEKDELDMIIADSKDYHITDKYILASIDRNGNQGSS